MSARDDAAAEFYEASENREGVGPPRARKGQARRGELVMDSPQTPSDEMIEHAAKLLWVRRVTNGNGKYEGPQWDGKVGPAATLSQIAAWNDASFVLSVSRPSAVSKTRTTQLETENAALKKRLDETARFPGPTYPSIGEPA